ncbi:MAG: 4Fe-4S binding protein [Candidatus Acetothermia bacterium]|jgi:polyferredoxin|nr:4Fe-4S binding protein [Candidatus Acetothermia bacterium]
MRLRYLRRGTQGLGVLLGVFGVTGIGMTHLLFPGLHCYACPLAITVCPIGLMQNLIIAGTVPFYLVGAVAAYGLALGRGWCGWFCPFGTVNDLLAFRKGRFRRALSPLKFLVLVGTGVAAWNLADTWFCKLCPAASLTASLPYLGLGVAQVNTPFLVHMGTLAGTLVGMALVSRFWCRYLCPMGAVLSVFNRVSLFGLRLRADRCGQCGLCVQACPMGIEPHRDINSPDCIKCGECVPVCKAGALSIGFSLPGVGGRVPLRASGASARADRVPPRQ